MSTKVEQAPAATTESTTGRTTVPTWAALKSQYKGAEGRGVKARHAAYDAIARGFALTAETESGAVKARSEASRAREVIDAFKIESGNVFGLSPMRIAQVVKVYKATARAGLDPFSDAGRAVFTPLDQVRKFDADALNKAADAVKGAPDKADKILSDAVETAKETAKARKGAGKDSGKETVTVVKSMSDVTAFVQGNLPLVRQAAATASEDDKAALRKALESMLAHVQ